MHDTMKIHKLVIPQKTPSTFLKLPVLLLLAMILCFWQNFFSVNFIRFTFLYKAIV